MSSGLFSKLSIDSARAVAAGKAAVMLFGTVSIFFMSQLIGIVLVVSVLDGLGYSGVLLEDLFDNNTFVQFIGILVIQLIVVGLLYAVYHIRKQNLIRATGLNKPPQASQLGLAAVTYGLYFMAFVLFATVISLLIPALDTDQSQQLGFDSPAGFDLVLVYASLVILPAIVEEIMFRGVLFQKLRQFIGFKTAAVLTSIVFGAAHLEFFSDEPFNWIAALDTFVFSFFLIWLLVRTQSLWSSIFLHGLKNSIAFVLLFII